MRAFNSCHTFHQSHTSHKNVNERSIFDTGALSGMHGTQRWTVQAQYFTESMNPRSKEYIVVSRRVMKGHKQDISGTGLNGKLVV